LAESFKVFRNQVKKGEVSDKCKEAGLGWQAKLGHEKNATGIEEYG